MLPVSGLSSNDASLEEANARMLGLILHKISS